MIAIILLAIAGGAVGVAVKLLTDPFDGGPVRFWEEVVPALGLSAFALFLTYLFGFPGYLVLAFLRQARWLDGTRLGHRRLLGTVWVDLATARVSMGWQDEGYRLVAVSELGTEVTLPLREGGGTLPREQLHAVANAIRVAAGEGDQARAVAQQLRRLASEPDAVLPDQLPERAAAAPEARPGAAGSGRSKPVLLLGLAMLLLMTSVSGAMWARTEAHRWVEFQRADECRASPGPAGCRTDPAATIEDASYCTTRYCANTRTRYVLQLSGGERTEAEFHHRVGGPAEGDEVAVRMFHDRVVSLHDGSGWVDTNANPRVALPFTFALASAFLGAAVGVLLGAVSAGAGPGGWWRRPHRPTRYPWGRIGVICFLTPLPALFVARFFGSPPIWVLLLVDALTAITAIASFRRGRLRGPAGADAAASGL